MLVLSVRMTVMVISPCRRERRGIVRPLLYATAPAAPFVDPPRRASSSRAARGALLAAGPDALVHPHAPGTLFSGDVGTAARPRPFRRVRVVRGGLAGRHTLRRLL